MRNPTHHLVPALVHIDLSMAQNVVAVWVAAAVAAVIDPAIDCTVVAGEYAVDASETECLIGLDSCCSSRRIS